MHFQIVWLMPLKLFSCCADTHSDPISLIFNRERTNRFLRWLMLRLSPMRTCLLKLDRNMVAQLWLRPRLQRDTGMRIPQPRAHKRLPQQSCLQLPARRRLLEQLANNGIPIENAGHAGRSTWSPLTFGVSDLPHSLDAGRFAAPRPRRTARKRLEEPFFTLTLADSFKAASP